VELADFEDWCIHTTKSKGKRFQIATQVGVKFLLLF